MGGSALSVGAVLAPMTIAWPVFSIASGRLILRLGYKPPLIAGMAMTGIGSLGLLLLQAGASQAQVMATVSLIGAGMGLTSSPLIIAIQGAVAWNQRGIATSLNQFARTIGGSCGVAVMGALMNLELARGLQMADVDTLVSQVLDPAARAAFDPAFLGHVQTVMAAVLRETYAVPVACAAAGFALVALKFPGGSIHQLAASPVGAAVGD
jgi:MFS family permease